MFIFIYMDFVLSERQKEIERQREAELAHSTNTRAGPG